MYINCKLHCGVGAVSNCGYRIIVPSFQTGTKFRSLLRNMYQLLNKTTSQNKL